jgi:hypothetical protein
MSKSFEEVVGDIRNQMNGVSPNYIRSLHKLFATTGECPNRRVEHEAFKSGLL